MEKLVELTTGYRAEALAFFALAAAFATFRMGTFPVAWRRLRASDRVWHHFRLEADRDRRALRAGWVALNGLIVLLLMYAVYLLTAMLHEISRFHMQSDALALSVAEHTFGYLRDLQSELNNTLIILILMSIVELLLATATIDRDDEEKPGHLDALNAHVLAEAGGWENNAKALWAKRAQSLFGPDSPIRQQQLWEDKWCAWYVLLCAAKRRGMALEGASSDDL